LRERDVIVRFAGKPIANVDDLHRLLTDERSAVACQVEVVRGTDLLKVTVTPRPRLE
jgi:S1-C subfamily serine protease